MNDYYGPSMDERMRTLRDLARRAGSGRRSRLRTLIIERRAGR